MKSARLALRPSAVFVTPVNAGLRSCYRAQLAHRLRLMRWDKSARDISVSISESFIGELFDAL